MMYDILVTINNSPSKTRKWRCLVKPNSREEAKDKDLPLSAGGDDVGSEVDVNAC